MGFVNIHEAKTRLSQLIEAVESGAEPEIIIARNGKPAVRLVPIGSDAKPSLWGAAKGKWDVPDDIDGLNADIERMFNGEPR
jgi:prevent-host-death family protein